jgi:hypothetical protein
MGKPQHPREADVEIEASARADELTARDAPETESTCEAEPRGEGGVGSDRTNLPDRLSAGSTYRDIQIDYRLACRLDDPAELAELAELGERTESTEPTEPTERAAPDDK